MSLSEALKGTARVPATQYNLFEGTQKGRDVTLYYSGNISLLQRPCVAIVGTRKVSKLGKERTAQFSKVIAEAGIVVVSGLAAGVDTAALRSAIASGGSVVAVIGTPLDKAYPAENKKLQEEIYRDHLLISQFPIGADVWRSNFPQRNKLMAFLSDATLVMEASDTSGTLHQAVECSRLGRWLLIDKRVSEDPHVTWPRKFLANDRTNVVECASDICRIFLDV